ncbi:MAG: hypothetical protein NTX32_04180 [Candidatus Firestonebacteria bacterium]|nr:hypothetical protein [Candidatus Firestonebacteria bacterium]
MKPRVPEAERLEENYLQRLKNTLANRDTVLANEIMQGIRDHIEEAVNESLNEEISSAQMANILEKLGAPETYINDYSASGSGAQADVKKEDPGIYSEIFNKLWIACFIGVLGLYVPVINIYFCTIIYLVLIILIFRTYSSNNKERTKSIIKLSIVQIILLTIYSITSILGLHFINIFLDTVVFVITMTINWKIFGEMSAALRILKNQSGAEYVEGARIKYIIFSIIAYMGFIFVGVLLAYSGQFYGRHDIVKFALFEPLITLPIGWLIGWLFLLRPISRAKQSIKL